MEETLIATGMVGMSQNFWISRRGIIMKNLLDFCVCCQSKVEAEQTDYGAKKYKCLRCGTIVISSIKGKRHVMFEIFGPKSKTK